MRLWPGLVAVALGACIEPNLTVCPGYDCAPGEVCDLAHHGCATQDQLDACAGVADGTACSAGALSGACFDGVCLEPGCGNRVVEPGEQCDDGNHVSGDGCSLDCTSNETCGNGVVDAAFGEACDDGNLVSHDGCNSRCQIETLVLDAFPINVIAFNPRTSAYDAARGKLVYVGSDATWELSGTTWTVASIHQSLITYWEALVYVPDDMHVVGFGSTAGGKPVVAVWDGSTWTEVVASGAATGTIYAAVYDPTKHSILALLAGAIRYFDLTGYTWSDPAPMPFTVSNPSVAVDSQSNELVVVDPAAGATWTFASSVGWVAHPSLPPGVAGTALTYDLTRQAVVAIGGATGTGADGTISTWDDMKWTAVASIAKRQFAAAWSDATALTVYGGTDGAGKPLDDVVALSTGASITDTPMGLPPFPGEVAYDSVRHRLVMQPLATTATWTWDGAWHALASSGPSSSAVLALAFDPERGVVARLDGTTWALTDAWHAAAVAQTTAIDAGGLTYDYGGRQLVVANIGSTFGLAGNAAMWTSIGDGIAAGTAAYDLGTAHVVALDSAADGELGDLVGSAWEPSLSPGIAYRVASWFARRTVVLVPTITSGSPRELWERRGTSFTALGPLPLADYNLSGVTELSHGKLALTIDDTAVAYVLELQYTSSLADETCAPDEDADGDGLSGCADPDCWEQCWPACPYATACP